MTFDWTIKVTDIAIVLAALLGPVLAVQAQKFLERKREQEKRRVDVFKTLMATRAAQLSPAHVEALNAIPLEFYGPEFRSINEAWKVYLDHLNDQSQPFNVWQPKRQELFIDLLNRIASVVSYRFSKVELNREIYFPIGHSNIEQDQELIRKGLASLFNGKFSWPIEIKSPSQPSSGSGNTNSISR